MSEKFKIGLAGCGIWGRLLLQRFIELDCEVQVVDPDEGNQKEALRLGASEVGAALETLEGVDAFAVATPASTHYDTLSCLVKYERPIFCEKPFTTSVENARELEKIAGDRISLGHVWRYHSGILKLKEIIDQGVLGRISGVKSVRVNWTSPRTDTDAVWTLGPHDLTIYREFFGVFPEAESCLFEYKGDKVVSLFASYQGEHWLVSESSNRYGEKRREVRVHGEKGVAVLPRLESPHVELYFDEPGSLKPRFETRPFEARDALRVELKEYLSFAKGEIGRTKSMATEGVKVVELLSRIREMGARK